MKEQDLRAKLSAKLPYYSVADNERKTNECVQITLDYAREESIGFSEWLDVNCVQSNSKDGWWIYLEEGWKTTNELYEIYLTSKTK